MEADPDGNTVIFQLLLLLLFTLMNAFFAGAEMAVVSVNRNRIRSLAEDGNKKARVIQGLDLKLDLLQFFRQIRHSNGLQHIIRWRSLLRVSIPVRRRLRASRRFSPAG